MRHGLLMRQKASSVAFVIFNTFLLCLGQELEVGGSGWALRFDGSDDLVILDQNLPDDFWTIDMWVKPLGLKDGAGLDIVSYSSSGVLIAQSSMTSGLSPLMINYNGAELRLPSGDLGNLATDEVDPRDAEGVLFHYAVAKTPTNATIYFNGVAAGVYEFSEGAPLSRNSLSPLIVGARYMRIAGRWETTDRNFGGIIDELRFWDVALSADDVKFYMGRPAQSSTPGLFDQWKFDEGDGDSVEGSYWLGGGDSLAYPTWVPSPVVRHGGPVAMSARIGETTSQTLCALLTPALAGAQATVALDAVATVGTLTLTSSTLEETTEGVLDGSMRFCTSVTLLATAVGFENVPFTVTVTSPGGSLASSQNVSMSIVGNKPPSAGSAKAVQVNGEDQYLSLGSWDPGDSFTMSFWIEPVRMVSDTTIVSIHQANGQNLFLYGYGTTGYIVISYCTLGCGDYAYGRAEWPTAQGSEYVLSTGLTADEVIAISKEAHQLTLSWDCLSRGDTSTGETAKSHMKLYQDGMLIGENAELPACLNAPLLPERYADGDLTRPGPWELGEEYDGGTMDEHQENVAVTPSNFVHATLDDFTVWKRILTDEEVLSLVSGAIPHEDDIIVRFTFDLDDEEDCQERQLWDTNLVCQGVNEERGRISPSELYPWTMAPIEEVTTLPSPFYQLRGSPIHRSMAAGTCANITLLGADADGDSLTYSLGDSYPGVSVTVFDDQLRFCDDNASRTTLAEVEFLFDACDPYSACASSVSGLASAIFHILPVGPKLLAFQAVLQDVRSQSFLRLVFDRATSCPTFLEADDFATVVQLSFTNITVLTASWETGCAAVRMQVLDGTSLESFAKLSVTAEVLQTGGLRDKAETSFPVVGVSPVLETISCTSAEVLLPGAVSCQSCQAGYVAGVGSDGFDECQPCDVGTAGVNECSACDVGRFSNATGLTECYQCPVGHSCPDLGLDEAQPCFSGYYQQENGASSCSRCPAGSFSEKQGSSTCTSCRSDTTTAGTGFTSPDDCECAEGSYRLTADTPCVECGTGAVCDGFGAAPEAASGYMLYSVQIDYLDIFSCSDSTHCPGGVRSTCAEGREGVSCAACISGRTSSHDGTCQPCSGADSVISVSILTIFLLLVIIIYQRVKNHDNIRLRHETMLAMTTTTQIILVLQLSSVLARLSIEWPQPMRDLMHFLLLFNFDFDILRVGCVKSLSDFDKYVAKLSIIPVATLGLASCHVITSLLKKEDLHAAGMRLLGAIGIFVSALYISLTNVIAAPLQCLQHPNGRWTMVSAEAVLCWEGGDHTVMIALGCLFLVIPLTFFGLMVFLMKEFPVRMSRGDVAFLNSFSFLFMRVRPEARWFVIFQMARNGVIALIPVLPNAFWQCWLLVIVFASSAGVSLFVWPWKLSAANVFDITVSYIFVALGCLALPFVSDTDTKAIPEVAMALLILSMCLTPWVLIHWIVVKALGKRKVYRWFLCHHKASAGSFARLLKLSLTEQSKQHVFLDSDDLVDLNNLFMYVKSSVHTLTILCTKEVLYSLWCLGELAVARLSSVDILPIFWVDFGEVEDQFIEQVDAYVGLDKLTETGLSLEDIRRGLQYLQNPNASIQLPDVLTEASLQELIKSIKTTSALRLSMMEVNSQSKSMRLTKMMIGGRSTEHWTHAVLVDLQNQEAIAGGLILVKMLRPLFTDGTVRSFFVAGLDSLVDGRPIQIPLSVTAAILLCTSGCFSSQRFLQVIVVAVLGKVPHILPAAANKDFAFPGIAFYVDLEITVKQLCVAAGAAPEGSLLTSFVKSIFQKIFMHFFVLDSKTILGTQARIIHDRLAQHSASPAEVLTEQVEGQLEILKRIYEHSFEASRSGKREEEEEEDEDTSGDDSHKMARGDGSVHSI